MRAPPPSGRTCSRWAWKRLPTHSVRGLAGHRAGEGRSCSRSKPAARRKLQAWKSNFETEFPDATKRSGVLNQAEAIIREYSSDRGHEAAIRQALVETGMANHPAMIRLLSNVAAAMDEGKPVPAQAPTPVASSKAGKLYR